MTTQTKRGLGRGLEALIPTGAADDDAGPGSIVHAPIGAIETTTAQPRKRFDRDQLEELAASIRKYGILQPLVVKEKRNGRGYELIAGERRWRAAGMAGLDTVPVYVRTDVSGEQNHFTAMALIENLQRADLNPIEVANGLFELSRQGWSQERIATQIGKSRTSVANLLRLRKLPHSIQQFILEDKLSEGHGRALLAAADWRQEDLAVEAVANNWTVRQLEAQISGKVKQPNEPTPQSDLARQSIDMLEAALGTRVEVTEGRKGGKIVVHWYDEEQLYELAEAMSRPEPAPAQKTFGSRP